MKTSLSKALIFLSALHFIEAFCLPADTIYINDKNKYVNLLPGLKIFHTPKTLSPQTALSEIEAEGYTIQKSSVGFTRETYWVAFTVKNVSSSNENYILEIKNPQIDYLKVSTCQDNSITPIFITGDQFHFNKRMIWSRNFIFPIQIEQGEIKSFLIEIYKRNSSLNFPMALWHQNQYSERVYLENLGYGIYFGFILLCIIYSFLTFIFLRKSTYFWYSAWGIFSGLYIFTALGFSHQFLYPHIDDLNSIFRIFVQKVSMITFFMFSSHFLNFKKFAPITYKIINGAVIGFVIILIPLPFRPPFYMENSHLIIPTIYCIAIILIVLIVRACVLSYPKQKANAFYYLIAFSALMISAFILIFEEFGWIPANLLVVNPFMIGSSIEMLILSIGITYQIKKVYDERNMLSLKFAQQQKELLKAYVSGVERERERISRELHDDIGSRLSTLNRFMSKSTTNTNEKLQEQIEILCDDVRDMSHRLAPATLKITGLKNKISELISALQTDGGIQADVQFYDFPDELENEMTNHIYRILQEAFHNITKHAHATLVDLQFFGYEDELVITIEDNGKGFKQHSSKGIGLQNMQARAASLNGTLEVSSQPGQGTQIMLRIPMKKKQEIQNDRVVG